MSEHTHTTLVDGCYRCELNRDEMAETAPEDLPDTDLPGGWSKADFTGGDPDERSYTERGWVEGHDDNSASERGSHWED